MMKSLAFNRNKKTTPAHDEGVSLLLESSFMEKIYKERDDKLKADRRRHADAIAALNDQAVKEGLAFDNKIAKAAATLQDAERALLAAREALAILHNEKRGFFAQIGVQKNMHESELRESAPYIDDAKSHLLDQMAAASNIQTLESKQTRETAFGVTGVLETNIEAAQRWHAEAAAAFTELEALKLEPDHTAFPAKIEKILGRLHDPENLPVEIYEVVNGRVGNKLKEKQ